MRAALARSTHLAPALWSSPLAIGLVAITLGAAIGIGVVEGSPVGALAVGTGVVVAVAIGRSVYLAVVGLIAVASLLPFGVIPVRVGVQLTMVDVLLGAIFVGWLARVAAGTARLELPAAARAASIYVAIAVIALIVGAAYAPPSGSVVRSFLKYVVAILLVVPVFNVARSHDRLRHLIRVLIVGATIAAVVGVVIHRLPRATMVELLSSLAVVGYPAGPDVIRFRPGPNNTYTDVVRATGTSIDPNVFGGLLMLAGALMLGQWFSARPVLPRVVLIPLGLVVGLAMLLSDSRSSWVGLAAAAALLATVRDRRLWLLAVPVVLGLLYLPAGQDVLQRLVSGFTFADRAAALRLDEYRQAIQIISAYPVLGVGFGGAPEAGTFVGVSSIYLLVGEHTGLVGLTVFLVAVGIALVGALRALWAVRDADGGHEISTLLAPVVAALTAGLFDHYFMNPQFPHMVALFWLYIGLLLAASRLARDDLPVP